MSDSPRGRGRPRKEKPEGAEDQPKRPRGRPRKEDKKPKLAKAANYNPKSRDNLVQYSTKKVKQTQKKLIKGLAEEIDFELDPAILEVIIPTADVFTSKERIRFMGFLKLYMNEFGKDSVLSVSDVDDIAQLCKNKILEDRLLVQTRKDTGQDIPDVMSAVDKFKKENAKLKEQLAANRSVRIDPRAGRDLTVLDVLYEFDREASDIHKNELLDRLEAEEKAVAGLAHTTVDDMIV